MMSIDSKTRRLSVIPRMFGDQDCFDCFRSTSGIVMNEDVDKSKVERRRRTIRWCRLSKMPI